MDTEELIEIIRESEDKAIIALSIAIVSALAIGLEYLAHIALGVPKWGAIVVMVYLSFLGAVSYIIHKEGREMKEIEALGLLDQSEQLSELTESNKELSSTLEASKELADKLGREVEAERKQVTRLTSALSLVKDELHKCNEALDTCQDDLAKALTSASEEKTRANELAHRCEQLSSNQGTLVSKEVTRLQEQITTQQKTIKGLSARVKELAPYSAFYKLYESYKASDSQIKSLNRDKALSDEDREDAKQKARIELEKAKEGMISIQESLMN